MMDWQKEQLKVATGVTDGSKPQEKIIEIEFIDWVHPSFGVMPAKMEGGGPLILRARIKEKNA